jgi:toxin ParE1/3/4
MKRLKVVFRPEAISDLQRIFIYIAESSASETVASRFVDRIKARCSRIGSVPYGGRPRDDLAAGLRTVPFEHSAVIAYRITSAVEITNIFYGGRDYEALYQDKDNGA